MKIRFLASGLAAFVCASQAACFGPNIRKEKVLSVEPQVVGATFCPGSEGDLVVGVTLLDGKKHTTKGAGRGDVAWEYFPVTPTVVSFREGRIAYPEDPRDYLHTAPSLRIDTAGHPDKSFILPLPVQYSCAYVANFSGRDGPDGKNGENGSDATAQNRATPGHYGDDGTAGASAEDITVQVALVKTSDAPFLEVQVRGRSSAIEHRYLIDTRGGSLLVKARGGAGGRGGDGGSAGGNESAGGGGSGGLGGNGGNVTVVIDGSAVDFGTKMLKFDLGGGLGGAPGLNRVGTALGSSVLGSLLAAIPKSKGVSGTAGNVTVRSDNVPSLWPTP